MAFNTLKKVAICTTMTSATIGFYRGCEWFHYTEIKNKSNIDTSTYAYIPISGIMFASTYANPTFVPFIMHSEYAKLKMVIEGNYDEKQYYENFLFSAK